MTMTGMMVLAVFVFAVPVMAGPLDVSATLSATPDGSDFDYTIVLKNASSSTDSLETFWFGWVPGKDFLPTSPISVTPPTGWADRVTHGGATDGFAIQFVTSTDPLAPGQSLDFMFKSADTPAQIAGNSPFYPTIPAETSFVFQGAPFRGDSAEFRVRSTPEPSTLALAGVAALGVIGYAWRRKAPKVS
jgi:hypothetical protein